MLKCIFSQSSADAVQRAEAEVKTKELFGVAYKLTMIDRSSSCNDLPLHTHETSGERRLNTSCVSSCLPLVQKLVEPIVFECVGGVRVPASCAHVPISHRVLQGLMSQVLRSLLPSRLQASNRACGPLLRACRLGVNLASHRSLAAPSRVCHRLDCPRPHATAARYPFSDNTALDAMAPMAHDSARKEKAELCCGELARLCEVQRSTPQTLSAQKLRPRQFDLQGSSTQRKFAAALWLSTFSGTRRWAVPRPVSLLRLGWMFSTGPRIV